LGGIFDKNLFVIPTSGKVTIVKCLSFIICMLAVEWFGKNNEYGIANFKFYKYQRVRYLFYFLLAMIIICYGSFDSNNQFIYFQF